MKKIAILTCFNGNYNYGGILQAYALCKKINLLGYEGYVVDYEESSNPVYPTLKEQMSQYSVSEVVEKSLEKIINKKFRAKIEDVRKERFGLFDQFVNKEIPHTVNCSDSDISTKLIDFDVFMVGSDQVWNPNAIRKGFLLSFVDESKVKVSYASSFGRNSLVDKEKNVIKQYVEKFDSIAVREKSGKKILEDMGCKDVTVVLDPTLLLDEDIWLQLSCKRVHDKKYVFGYFFSDSVKYRNTLKEYCIKNNIELLYIPYAKQEYNFTDEKGFGIPLYNIGPKEFISLIRHAEFIITDSFHGTAFSIIFEKEFITFNRNKSGSKTSMNARLNDILQMFELSDRMCGDISKLDSYFGRKIDYANVKKILEQQRLESLSYLVNCVSNE